MMIIKDLAKLPYADTYESMKRFTHQRDEHTPDEIWLLEHESIFTQGQAGKEEHVLFAGDIEVFHSDRGGQVTYHGPGQMMAYVLFDLKRLGLGIRDLVCLLERSVIELLKTYGIDAFADAKAPGVYVQLDEHTKGKICSLGLRIHKSRSYHGLALNVDMDLSPFERINPCGFAKLKMLQIRDFKQDIRMEKVKQDWVAILQRLMAQKSKRCINE